MNYNNCYLLLHTLLISLTLILYLKKWGELIQVRSYAIYITVPILWSCVFLLLLLKLYPIPIDQENQHLMVFSVAVTACYYWIGMLSFPLVEQLDRQNQFAYLDYYEHFRKQIPWIMGLALLAFLLEFWIFWSVRAPDSEFFKTFHFFLSYEYNFVLIGLLILAFFSEHKGLVCLLAWLLLSVLILT